MIAAFRVRDDVPRAGILIGQLTGQWSSKIEDADNSLANAGNGIVIVERIIVLILVLQNQYSAIGLLVTAKGIIRFNEKDRQEVKNEYLCDRYAGLSIGIAGRRAADENIK